MAKKKRKRRIWRKGPSTKSRDAREKVLQEALRSGIISSATACRIGKWNQAWFHLDALRKAGKLIYKGYNQWLPVTSENKQLVKSVLEILQAQAKKAKWKAKKTNVRKRTGKSRVQRTKTRRVGKGKSGSKVMRRGMAGRRSQRQEAVLDRA
jgi:hypothetical protein